VTEFSCVHDKPSWKPSNDQKLINDYFTKIAPLFERDNRVHAYA
jgi:hypothetical protein